ncbi:hypothetical protein AA15237_2624 [Komagataeibacter xylinus NBRC 15237]|nr:hypothetical protein AA15237_2624 [Komagataeibacter xylinus NBRC 15237]
MAAARKPFETGACRLLIFRLGQDAAAEGHDRIGSEHEGRAFNLGRHMRRLFSGEALGIGARQFITAGRFIDIGWKDLTGHKPDLAQQVKPAG